HNGYIEAPFAIVPKEAIGAVLGEEQKLSDIQAKLKSGPYSFDLNRSATLRAQFEHADETSANVVGLLRGRDLANEYVVYTAHLDHDGTSAFFKGDPVLHGALDNAGGVATILADARAFTRGERPRRSILFIAVTAEEKGGVGSDYFVHHPTVPHASIVADINCDNFLWYFPVRDVSGVGREYSTLNSDFVAAAKDTGIEASAPMKIQQPLLVLSDHFSFLNDGIPAVSIFNGEASGDGKRSGSEIWAEYFRNVHHTPKDSIDQPIDWQAAVTEARFAYALGARVANDPGRPHFNAKAFFTQAP
ncbi:MAG TPA: M20/M25/M40 family metallo-hydrolase, partial [Thermoanaerobaculia bacterium]